MKKFRLLALTLTVLLLASPISLYAKSSRTAKGGTTTPTTTTPTIPTTPTTPTIIDISGLMGDGITNNNTSFSTLIKNAPAYSQINLEPSKNYVISTPIILTKPVNINLMGSTITCKNSASAIDIQTNDVTIQNGIIELDYSTHNGIVGSTRSNLSFVDLTIKDQIISATNQEGGIYLKSCNGVSIKQCSFINIFNSSDPGTVDHSPAVKLIYCTDCTIEKFTAENCGVGINNYGSQNVTVSDFNMSKINNNGFYIQDKTQNLNIFNGKIDGAENGLVFKLTNYTATTAPTTVRCSNVEFDNVTNKGISLRNGSGLSVTNCVFNNNNNVVGQSTSSTTFLGCSNIIVNENRINNSKTPMYFKNDIIVNASNNTFENMSSTTYAIKIDTGCSDLTFNNNMIIGDGMLVKNIN